MLNLNIDMVHNKSTLYILSLFSLVLIIGGCQNLPLQTVESGDLLLDEKDPSYKFYRNQESSVDIQEPQYVRESINDLGIRFLDQAYLRSEYDMQRAKELYNQGIYGYAPYDYISTSNSQQPNREAILNEIEGIFLSIAEISGYYADNPTAHRRREAVMGSSGLISNGLGTELIFVDAKGLMMSEVFQYMALGTIALDQIMNVHLDDNVIKSEQIIQDHENHRLIKGQNYTALEHHWDLAYGYYKFFWRPMAKGDGIPALRGCLRQLDLAFTLGRMDINYHLYDELPKYVDEIRRLLTKVILIRTKEHLLGGHTISNLNEDLVFAFPQLSRGYALLYSMAFINDAEGRPYFTYEEVKEMQQTLLGEKGLWDSTRLLSDEKGSGTLKSIEEKLTNRLNIN